jgi:putative transferase (TIGR04331 family)
MPQDTNISYLGTWVLPEEDLCNKGKFEILEYCYDDHDELFSDFTYIKSLYSLILPIIGDLLNEHHSLSWSSRSFKIFHGAWLHEYLPVIRERYKTIQTALRAKPSYSFILTDCNIGVADAADFKKKITEDDYNHYLYSKVVKFIDCQVYENSYFVSKSIKQKAKGKVIKRLVKNILKEFLLKNLQIICNVATRGSKAAVDRSYFSKKHFIQLIIGSFPRITPIVLLPTLRRTGLKQEMAVRDKLHKSFCSLFSPKTDFETFLAQTLIYDMPLSFIESFKNVLHESTYVNLKNKNYLSSNAILSNQILQCAAANQLFPTSDLIIAQHGGSYGIAKWSMQQFYELNTADRYISFGWERREFSNIAKISHPKLLLKNSADKLKNLNILYITWAPSRYFNRNWSVPIAGSAIIDYYKNILVLLKAVKPNLKRHISVRLAPSDSEYKVGVGKFLGGGVKLAKGDFYQELNAASLVICDHNQTTMIESMGANRPTIIVWNSDYNKIDQLAVSFFEKLSEVGIFYSCHTKAAAFINDIVDKNAIDEWWRDTSRQNAVSSFVAEYCKRNDNWIVDYQEVLRINKKM